MNNKLLPIIIIIILTVSVFAVLMTVVYAKNTNLLCSNRNIIITLKNEADISKSKDAILKIPHIKIVKIQDRNKEWSKMVNKMDLPNMENPFKNEITVKIKKSADINEVYDKIKEMSFVEKVEYPSGTECGEK